MKRTVQHLVALAFPLALACKEAAPVLTYQATPVEQRNIVVSARAAGSVLPDTVVEVKSKASGEILDLLVETGSVVTRGTLLVRVDRRTPQNRFNEAEANLTVAQARHTNAQSQKARADELFKTQSITQEEHESAALGVANSRAEVVRAEVALENAKIALDDTDVRAPITGTVISKSVERGQVISSPTTDVGGGTVLLKMADLDLVQVRTLVDETDIGKLRAGLRATVRVEAYPNQPFQGEVLKIEPLAETQQNVTMFPVIVRIENRNGLLKPGMNADVEIHVGQRDNVLAIQNAALRTQRDVGSAAMVLGIGEDQLKTLLAAAAAERDSARSRLAAARGDSGRRDTLQTVQAGAAAAAAPQGGNTMTMGDRTIQLPEGVTEAQVRNAMRKRFSGETLTPQETAMVAQITRGMGGGGGQRGGQGGGGGGRGPRGGQGSPDFQFGGDYIVFVLRNGQPTPVHVRTGLTDLDYSEIVTGLTSSDSVLVLPSASLIQAQEAFKERMNRFTGGGSVPGMQRTTTGSTPAAGGGRP